MRPTLVFLLIKRLNSAQPPIAGKLIHKGRKSFPGQSRPRYQVLMCLNWLWQIKRKSNMSLRYSWREDDDDVSLYIFYTHVEVYGISSNFYSHCVHSVILIVAVIFSTRIINSLQPYTTRRRIYHISLLRNTCSWIMSKHTCIVVYIIVLKHHSFISSIYNSLNFENKNAVI